MGNSTVAKSQLHEIRREQITVSGVVLEDQVVRAIPIRPRPIVKTTARALVANAVYSGLARWAASGRFGVW